jgi:hypothetical protein
MEKFEKVSVLDNEIQARLLESVLMEMGIPHMIRTYHDTALNGLFQGQFGWGHVETPPEFKDKIIAIINDLSKNSSMPECGDE